MCSPASAWGIAACSAAPTSTWYGFGEVEAVWLGENYCSMDLVLGARAWLAPPLRGVTPGPVAL